jgi:glyoxylate/hydroxypyruvate reductase A
VPFKNLKALFNLGAGVDALLADKTIPAHLPIVRAVSPDLTGRMVEYVTLHVLAIHRRMRDLSEAQRARIWATPDQPAAREVRVGILGLGELGRASASVLFALGFQVMGWSRRPQSVDGVISFSGPDGLDAMLAKTDILVALLPLTPETRGILNAGLFRKLARDGVLGAPEIINAGRGGLQIEADILKALDDGTLGGATLDVFTQEPLPGDHPLWSHPKVTLTPHNAADSDPDILAGEIAKQIRAFEAGQSLKGLIDRAQSY